MELPEHWIRSCAQWASTNTIRPTQHMSILQSCQTILAYLPQLVTLRTQGILSKRPERTAEELMRAYPNQSVLSFTCDGWFEHYIYDINRCFIRQGLQWTENGCRERGIARKIRPECAKYLVRESNMVRIMDLNYQACYLWFKHWEW